MNDLVCAVWVTVGIGASGGACMPLNLTITVASIASLSHSQSSLPQI